MLKCQYVVVSSYVVSREVLSSEDLTQRRPCLLLGITYLEYNTVHEKPSHCLKSLFDMTLLFRLQSLMCHKWQLPLAFPPQKNAQV